MQASVPLGLCAMMPNTNNVAEQQPCDVFYGIPVHDIFCFDLRFFNTPYFQASPRNSGGDALYCFIARSDRNRYASGRH